MTEKKKITLGTVIATSVGAIFWIVVSCLYFDTLANTTPLILMIFFAISWSLNAIILITRYLKQQKQAE